MQNNIVQVRYYGPAHLFVGEAPLDGHHELQHLVVRPTGEHHVAGKQLVQAHAHGPQVDRAVICEGDN